MFTGAEQPRPDRLPHHRLIRDRLLGIRHETGVAPVLAYRADPPGDGGLHGYRNTLQTDTLKLVAKKQQSSFAVGGELPEDGLSIYGDDGDDLMMALARQIFSGKEANADGKPVVVELHASGASGNWQVVETVTLNSNGHLKETNPAEGQQSLFT